LMIGDVYPGALTRGEAESRLRPKLSCRHVCSSNRDWISRP